MDNNLEVVTEEIIRKKLRYFLKAENLYKNGKYKEAAEMYKFSAIPDDGRTLYNWGVVFLHGIDGKKYTELALEYFNDAVEKGDEYAKGALAYLYYSGELGKIDYQKAYHYAKLAAEDYDACGQFVLGILYFNGYYVEKNYNRAYECFEKVLECLYDTNNVKKDTYYILGRMNYWGQGKEKDFPLAREYFECYLNEDGEKKRDAEVFQYLGNIYLKGSNGLADYRKAYDYFNYSEKLEEDDENEFWIGILIYAGFGDSTLHEDEADKWLKKSKENGNVTAEECLNDEKTKMKFVNKFIE